MMSCSRKSPRRTLFPLCGSLFLLVLLGPITAQGTTYYVAITGNDSDPGTSARPWRNPQKCAASPITAGDTCIVRNGTYTDVDGNGKGIVVYVSSSSPSGTSSQPITIKSETPLGAMIIVPGSVNGPNAGFYITRPYYIIESFDISGGDNNGDQASHSGITFTGSATGGIARLNSIHLIGRTACSNSLYGNTGIFIGETTDVLIEYNRLYSIGRLRNGENDCSTTISQHDHGIYAAATKNLTIRRNVIYDTNRGYPIHIYKSGGTTTNLDISHNTFSGRSPTGNPAGHIILSNTINGASIKNNLSSDAQGGMVNVHSLTASNVTVSYTLTDTLVRATTNTPGITFSNNFENNTNLGFANKSGNDFRLSSKSAAINLGTTNGVPPVKDGRPDIGAYEYSEQDTTSPLRPTGLHIQ